MRDTAPVDERIHPSHHPAMDALPFQIDPTRQVREAELNERRNAQTQVMDALKARHQQRIELNLPNLPTSREQEAREQRRREERTAHDDYLTCLEATQQIERQSWRQIATVFTGDPTVPQEDRA